LLHTGVYLAEGTTTSRHGDLPVLCRTCERCGVILESVIVAVVERDAPEPEGFGLRK
jgi:hypothetical protein